MSDVIKAHAGLKARHVIEISLLDAQSMRKTCSAIVAHVPGAGRSRSAARASCRELVATLYHLDTGADARRLQICHDRAGAPLIRFGEELSSHRISLSHSGDWVAVALSNDVDVGIDVERIDRTRRTDKFGAFLGWSGDFSDPAKFYSKWTLWEACFKALEDSVLTECSEVFEALDRPVDPGSMSASGEWASYRGGWNDQISYSLVTRDQPGRKAARSFVVHSREKK